MCDLSTARPSFQNYFSDAKPDITTDVAGVIRLARLQTVAPRSANGCFRRATGLLRAPYPDEPHFPDKIVPPSPMEWAMLQRALSRDELYCRVFPHEPGPPDQSLTPADSPCVLSTQRL